MAPEEKTHLHATADPFDENEAEKTFLLSKPTCLIIVGKPGTGKATLGRMLSLSWKCIFIEAKELINEHIEKETEHGIKIQELLSQGLNVPEELVTQLIVDKIKSPEAAHLGYVLCGLPSLSEEYVKTLEQMELIKRFKLKPDVIINIKCPDKDLSKRLCGQKQDPETGNIYQREDWDHAEQEGEKEEEEEEEEEQEEEGEDIQGLKDVLKKQLVYRPEDFPENVDERIRLYKNILLRPLEDLIIDHDPQYLIELDGNKKLEELFGSVLYRLDSLGLRHGAVVMKLQSSEEEDTLEGMDSDDLFRALSSYRLIAPRYRWRRSRWGQLCPVALKEGYIISGLPEFAATFLDKIYLLSSEEAFIKFRQNPRPYLLPPMPLPPCKVAVLGPRSSGKTTLCNLIANKYTGKVLDMSLLITPHAEEAKKNALEKVRAEATESAINIVKINLQQERTLKEEDVVEEVEADHPEVRAIVDKAVELASQTPVTLPPDVYVIVLEKSINEVNEENKERFPGAPPGGGWVLDNFTISPDYWITMAEKGLLPDTIVCLRDSENNGKYLLNRLYLMNKQEVNNNISQRLQKERARQLQEEEDARNELQEIIRLQEEQKRKLEEMQKSSEDLEDKPESSSSTESADQLPRDSEQVISPQLAPSKEVIQSIPPAEPEPDIVLPAVPEGGFPDVPEMEPLKEDVATFLKKWKLLEPAFSETSQKFINFLEIANKSPEVILQELVSSMEKPLRYHGWERTVEDIDEEADDLQAELDVEEKDEEGEEEGKEEEEEEDEDISREKKRQYGDSKHFCPVVLKDNLILYPGLSENAAMYREKIYNCSTPEAKNTFLQNPADYVVNQEPLKVPPLRVFLLGTSGTGKTVNARWLADKLGIFHIQFQERLQEMMLSKLQKKVGPHYEEDIIEENLTDEGILLELENSGLLSDQQEEDIDQQEEDIDTQKEEVILTNEEAAVKSYLVDSEPLPSELLDEIVAEWWKKEPFRSTGVILDGFPSTLEEVQYIAERGFFPDIAVFLEVEENDICDRLLPPRLAKWKERQRKKQEYKQKVKEMKKKRRDQQIAKRRAELVAEQNTMNEEKPKKDPEIRDEDNAEEEEEEEDNIELMLSEEFPEEEEDEDEEEEQEEDVIEGMKTEIGEKCDSDADTLQSLKEELQRLMIPFVTISGGRKQHIVRYQLYENIKHIVENRESLFEKCYPVSFALANKMLYLSYKHPSIFGRWDPVKLSQGDVIKPVQNQENPGFPLIYRQYIYFFSTKENRDMFMKNPIMFIRQPKPKPFVPIRIAIVGPPKSGKTTVAKMFSCVYGLQRLSMGDAIRSVLDNQPETELALEIKRNLIKGLVVPDELAINCLEVSLMDFTCNTSGLVLDGYPATKRQVHLLEACRIIPIKFFELQAHMKEVLKRAMMDKKNFKRSYPQHDSAQIFAVRNSCYKQDLYRIKEYYMMQHQNWCEVDSLRSKWWVSNKVIGEVQATIKQIQTYLERLKEGEAAGIDDFCVTPEELLSRLGEFGQYCPVSLAQRGELVDCSVTSSLKFAAEFRGHYYKMASQEELNAFLETPELYVPPLAPCPLPSADRLPKRLTVADVKFKFPQNAEMSGYCPVTYLDGKQRYEALVPGFIDYAVEYRDKIYFFASEEKLQKFMRVPAKYEKQTLPCKLPPKKEPIILTSLPLTGYLEQGAATSLIKALNDVGCLKPKYPFLSVKRSALLYIAYHLKAFNHRNSDYVRKKYKTKMERFVEQCELITYLGNKMTRKYKEPQKRPIDFDFKMQSFLSLKDVDPTCI
ncbi:adenylate kinase 9 isoform X2 [Ascaphus truei]|uniref:adenylate kinase 9 isoform X2 n=1 Tax=Ascaphus truei TaxID=8439 RepID=UPI003F5ABD01